MGSSKNDKSIVYDNPKEVFRDTLYELGKNNKNIVFISCDTSLGCGADKFKEAFPDRHFEFGIQEQNAITEAAGMALSGKIPFIGAHASFIVLRTIEQIRDDLCKTKLNAIIVGRDFGLQLSMCGPTHMILEDVGLLRTIPNLRIIGPCDGPELRLSMMAACELDGPVYIRMSRQKTKRINMNNYKFEVGKGTILRKGKDVTIIATSTLVANAVEATEILEQKGIYADLINMHTIKPIDKDVILESTSKTKRVITVEEHSIIGGLGSAVAEILVKEDPVRMKMIGTEDCFAIVGQSYEQLLDHYGFTGNKIAVQVENFLND